MARFKLSESRIKGITRAGIYSDGAGLFLRVRKGGSRQFLFVVKRGGKRTELGLGGYGNPNSTAPVSLALAREKAEALRQRLARGEDIREDIFLKRQQARGSVSFWDCAQQLLEAKRPQWSNGKHAKQWEMTLRQYAEPLHDMPVADITVADVKACLLPHWQERPETASRLQRVSRLSSPMAPVVCGNTRSFQPSRCLRCPRASASRKARACQPPCSLRITPSSHGRSCGAARPC